MGLEVRVDRSRCIASKSCIHAAPKAFALDDQRIATVLDVTAEPLQSLIESAESCPTGAISVFEGTEQLA